MRLFDAIVDANHRALTGDRSAGFHLGDYASELPVVAMTCIDPRLHRLFPGAMGLPPESFIWLRNAGNIITDPLSSMTRSLALACAVKGGREIAIIGHTDCQVCRITMAELVERFQTLGVERGQLPPDLGRYFHVFENERDNVIQSVDLVRRSPLIGPRIPVQGLMVDVDTGKLDWVVNGYEVVDRQALLGSDTKMPEIGRAIGNLDDRIGGHIDDFKSSIPLVGKPTGAAAEPKGKTPPSPPMSAKPPPIPVPPPIHVNQIRRGY